MKRFVIMLILAVTLLTSCHKSEPTTVATISPGLDTVMTEN